jgi:hypothetical protein
MSAMSFLLRPRLRRSAAGRISDYICGPAPPRTFLDQLSARPLDIGDAGVERSAILLSLQPSLSSETSAFNRTRAFVSNCAERLPEPIKSVSFARSSAPSRTTYFLTTISYSVANHLQRCSAAPVIQKSPSKAMTQATRWRNGPPRGSGFAVKWSPPRMMV